MRPVLEDWSAPQLVNLPTGVTSSPSMNFADSSGKGSTKTQFALASFVPLTPCRLVDTRGVFSPVYAGGAFAANEVRVYRSVGNCGIPPGINRVKGVSLAITTPPTPLSGDIEVIRNGAALGGTVAMVVQADQWNSVSSTPGVDLNGDFQVQLRTTPGDVVIDINGYYVSLNSSTDDVFAISGTHSGGGVLFVTNADTGGAAVNAFNSTSGAQVELAFGANALDVFSGGMRVRGAGAGSGTFVTKHVVSTAGAFGAGGTLCQTAGSNTAGSVIDNPYANGDPNAIIIFSINGFGAFGLSPGPYEAFYNASCVAAAANKWSIFNMAPSPLPNGLTFNVMIIKP
jgi:hypothetical protein